MNGVGHHKDETERNRKRVLKRWNLIPQNYKGELEADKNGYPKSLIKVSKKLKQTKLDLWSLWL